MRRSIASGGAGTNRTYYSWKLLIYSQARLSYSGATPYVNFVPHPEIESGKRRLGDAAALPARGTWGEAENRTPQIGSQPIMFTKTTSP